MKAKLIMEITSNRGDYNKTRKIFLERTGQIHCSYCPYHGGENNDNKFYGSVPLCCVYVNSKSTRVRYPSWKLISKNKKQWNKKKLKIKKRNYKYHEDSFELFF